MTLRKTIVPLRARDSFFRDEFFSDCWEIMERQKKEFEQKCAQSLESSTLGSSRKPTSTDTKFGSTFLDSSRNHGSVLLDDELQFLPRRFNTHRYHPASLMIMDSDHIARKYSSGLGIHNDKDSFKVSLDVQQFSPEELTVRTVDNTIVIDGKHEEKEDSHGLVSRHFQRKYTLPSDVKVDEVQCSFTADGRLHVIAPRHPPAITQNGSHKTTTAAEFEKMTYDSKLGSSKDTHAEKTTTSTDKFREELKRAKDDFEKTRAELLERRAERKEEIYQEMKAARDAFDRSAADLLANKTERQDTFREEIRKAQEEFDKSASCLFSRDREDFRHSRLLRMFEPHFTAFPEFDPLPFWRRGKTSTLAEEFDKKSSLFDDFANSGRFGKTSLLESPTTPPELQADPDNFKVILDVHEFKPEELSVRTFDYYVEIEAKHEAKQDPHGFITRHFKRKYTLPRDVKATDVQCNLSSEGILVVTAPKQKTEELAKSPHHVPIQQKGSPTDVSGTIRNSSDASGTIRKVSGTSETKQVNHSELADSIRARKIEEALRNVDLLDDQILEQKTEPKVYQNVSTVHQVFTERKPVTSNEVHGFAEHEIPITRSHDTKSATSATTTTAQNSTHAASKPGERVIPIDQDPTSPGPRIEFPESRPESSASSLPFDFSRGKSEEPTSVASSVPPTFENLTTAPEERIIKIQVAH